MSPLRESHTHSEVAANVDIVPNPAAVNNDLEKNSGEKVHLEDIEVVEEELVDPKETKTDDTEYNTRVETKNCISSNGDSSSKFANLA